jgi:hypothetical protein
VSQIFRAGSKTKNRALLHKGFRKPKSGARINKDTNEICDRRNLGQPQTNKQIFLVSLSGKPQSVYFGALVRSPILSLELTTKNNISGEGFVFTPY